jgi:hypothetical protein
LPVISLTFSVRMDWLTPTTSPFILKSGPPELPGLMAASVWMMSAVLKKPPSGEACANWVRPSPETMPTSSCHSSRTGCRSQPQIAPPAAGWNRRSPTDRSGPLAHSTLTTAISASVSADHRSIGLIAGGESHLHFTGPIHHMLVGDDMPSCCRRQNPNPGSCLY